METAFSPLAFLGGAAFMVDTNKAEDLTAVCPVTWMGRATKFTRCGVDEKVIAGPVSAGSSTSRTACRDLETMETDLFQE
ncbi:MAG: hypothetical protein WCK77_14515 [Verrucomicrobiota bacterium]